ncbi:hypothetical protein BGZ63DRAFT_398353 [Mariannaea sp. PMI_226]|nr:hypothetical protein BGZ63DRAFT_398353 [Mariannaea sp. PMI_226]
MSSGFKAVTSCLGMHLTWRLKITHAVPVKVVCLPRDHDCPHHFHLSETIGLKRTRAETHTKQEAWPPGLALGMGPWDHGTMSALVNDARGALAGCSHSTPEAASPYYKIPRGTYMHTQSMNLGYVWTKYMQADPIEQIQVDRHKPLDESHHRISEVPQLLWDGLLVGTGPHVVL